MDNQPIKILYIIPGFDEGGAEVHVLNLIRELSSRGHEITLATSGGRLESELPENTQVIHLPVHSKNPVTIIYSALRLAGYHKKFHWEIIHAHSRVPAWTAWILSRIAKVKWLMTAHALYSLNFGIIALRHADGVICVSEAVRRHLQNYLPDETIIIPNGIIPSSLKHKDINHGITKFLTVGRLTRLKGIDVVLRALSKLKNYEWTLDIAGDGPQRQELQELARSLELDERVKFHGAQNKAEVEVFMSEASCLLFPSYSEGMGLVVLEAINMGLPVVASDLEALHEISDGKLIPAGDSEAWSEAIRKFLCEKVSCSFRADKIITVHEMALKVEEYYKKFAAEANLQ